MFPDLILARSPAQMGRWYPMQEDRPAPLQPLRILPFFDNDESGFSVDVLVFGYITDKGAEYENRPRYAIGYVNRKGQWFFHTVDGTYPNNDDAITGYIPLLWAYLPDPPAPYDNDLQPAKNG